jgi:hypothetical protein
MRFIREIVLVFAATPCAAFMVTGRFSVDQGHLRQSEHLDMAAGVTEALDAVLNAFPLFAAPSAALAAGQAALSQKRTLEINVEAAEQELANIKQKIKNTDTQINVCKFKSSFVFNIDNPMKLTHSCLESHE